MPSSLDILLSRFGDLAEILNNKHSESTDFSQCQIVRECPILQCWWISNPYSSDGLYLFCV